jgi:PilZ domain
MARCRIEGEDADRWRECAIFDLSMLGLGIDLPNVSAKKLQRRRITVLLELGRSVDMTVSGQVRNAESSSDGIVRVGVEFVGLSDTESAIVGLLEQRAASRFRSKSPVSN